MGMSAKSGVRTDKPFPDERGDMLMAAILHNDLAGVETLEELYPRLDGEAFEWQRGDVVAVPSWRRFEHRIDADATLFCMTDMPVLRAFNWVRTEDV